MKYIKLFEEYNPYDLMVMFPNERLKLFIEEIKRGEPNLNLVSDLINLGIINVQDEDGRVPLHWAARRGGVEVMKMLIAAGADLNVQDENGRTPLHWGTINGRIKNVRILIDAGADLDVQDNTDSTPLHTAVYCKQIKIARLLIDAGADQTILNNDGLRWDEDEEWNDDDE